MTMTVASYPSAASVWQLLFSDPLAAASNAKALASNQAAAEKGGLVYGRPSLHDSIAGVLISQNTGPAQWRHPALETPASGHQRTPLACRKEVQQNGVALAGLHRKNRKSVTARPERKRGGFSATKCNRESVKRCVIMALREFIKKCCYRFYSRGVGACFGGCRASSVADF